MKARYLGPTPTVDIDGVIVKYKEIIEVDPVHLGQYRKMGFLFDDVKETTKPAKTQDKPKD